MPIFDGFDSYVNGELNGQGGWAGSVSRFTVQTGAVYGGSGKAVATAGWSSGTIAKSLGSAYADYTMSIYMRIGNQAWYRDGMLLFFEGSTEIFRIEINRTSPNLIRTRNGVSYVTLLSGIAADTWYKCAIQWRSSDKKARYKINDNSWSSWYNPISAFINGINTIKLSCTVSSNTTYIYWDRIATPPLIFAQGCCEQVGEIKQGSSLVTSESTQIGEWVNNNVSESAQGVINSGLPYWLLECYINTLAMKLFLAYIGSLSQNSSNITINSEGDIGVTLLQNALSSELLKVVVQALLIQEVYSVPAPMTPNIAQNLVVDILQGSAGMQGIASLIDNANLRQSQVISSDSGDMAHMVIPHYLTKGDNFLQGLQSLIVNVDSHVSSIVRCSITKACCQILKQRISVGSNTAYGICGRIVNVDGVVIQGFRTSLKDNICAVISDVLCEGKPLGQGVLGHIAQSQLVLEILINELWQQTGHFVQGITSEIKTEDASNVLVQIPDWDIKLDGVSIKDKVKEIYLVQSESEIINHIEVAIADLGYYDKCSPARQHEEVRLTLEIDNKSWQFFIETRDKSETYASGSLSIWGRQQPASIAEGFAQQIEQIYENMMASEIAQDLAVGIAVDWQCEDYLQVKSFSFDGYPIEGIAELAESIAAVVRSQPDGGLVVRAKYPVKPKDLTDASPSYELTRDNILSIDESGEGPQYSKITVSIASDEVSESQYSIETGECCKPDGVELKLYRNIDSENYNLCVSPSGKLTKKETAVTEEITEKIEITDGKGATSKVIRNVLSYEGVDCQGSVVSISWTKGSSEVLAEDTLCLLLNITYETVYDLWELTKASDDDVLVSAYVEDEAVATSSVTAFMGDGLYDGGTIDTGLVFSENQAKTVGECALNDNYYRKRKYNIEIPYAGIEDGQIVAINDDRFNIYAKGYVRAVSLTIAMDNGALTMKQTLEVHTYETPVGY